MTFHALFTGVLLGLILLATWSGWRSYQDLLAQIPVSSAHALWARLAPWLTLSFLAPLLAIAFLYQMTMRTVLNRLTHLAASAAATVGSATHADLPYGRSNDELGLLSRTLAALIRQHHEDTRKRELDARERLKREYETLRVIGHHVRSPIQALLALNSPTSRSWPYINQISKAVRTLFGADRMADATGRLNTEAVRIGLTDFLAQLAANASRAGIESVEFIEPGVLASVEVDDGDLSDALLQVLYIADSCRRSASSIRIALVVDDGMAIISVRNEGPGFGAEALRHIFDLAAPLASGAREHRCPGLFVARELILGMHGRMSAGNYSDGAQVEIMLPLAAAARNALASARI